MTPRRPRYAYIEKLADRLLDEAGVTKAPVPVERLARLKGCRVVKSNLKEVSGILFRSDEGAIIGVNDGHAPTRQRFTIAHELGHLLLHAGQEVHYDKDYRVSLRTEESSTGTNLEEVEANFFAASLLMPDRLLRSDPRASQMDIENEEVILALSRAYGVSAQAMTHRLLRMARRGGF